MRVIFMGSPGFGLPSLRLLIERGHQMVLVVSQPDRPAGRSRRSTPAPVAAFARTEGLPLYQPAGLRTELSRKPLVEAQPDVIVVVAFGLMLPDALLALPPLGCLNVHPSLLPRYRGASPIQSAILNGDDETGVSIIRLTSRMDAGPILSQIRTPIEPTDDGLSIEERLAHLGAELLVETLASWAEDRLEPREQNELLATYCQRLERSDARLDWSRSAIELARLVRAFRGRGDAFTSWGNLRLKVISAEPIDQETEHVEAGTVFTAPWGGQRPRPLVATGKGSLALDVVALEGRPATTGPAFLNGYPTFLGAVLGESV